MSYSFCDIIGHSAADHFGWHGAQMVAPDRIALSSPNEPQRYPGAGLKITVHPGDNPIHSSGERNELVGMFGLNGNDENGASGIQYYGFSLYLPGDWKDTIPANGGQGQYVWLTPFQLHGPDNNPPKAGSPAFEVDICQVSGRFTLVQRGGDVNSPVICVTDLGPHVYDQWVDFLFAVKWAADATGRVTFWNRIGGAGQLIKQASWNTPTLYSSGGIALPHYWKSGMYSNVSNFTRMFYRGPVSRALTFEDAAQAAFG